MGPYGEQIKANWNTGVKTQTGHKPYLVSGENAGPLTKGQSSSLKTRTIGERTEVLDAYSPHVAKNTVDGEDAWQMLEYGEAVPRFSQINIAQNVPDYRTMSKYSLGKNIGGKIRTQSDIDLQFSKDVGSTGKHEIHHAINLPTTTKGNVKIVSGPNAGKIQQYKLNNSYALHKNKDLVYDTRQPAIRYGGNRAIDVSDEGATFTTKWNAKAERFDTEFVPKDDLFPNQHSRLMNMYNKPTSGFKNYLNYKNQPLEMTADNVGFRHKYGLTYDKGYNQIDDKTASGLFDKLNHTDPNAAAIFRDKKAYKDFFNKANYGIAPIGLGGASLINNSSSSSGYKTGGVRKHKKGGTQVDPPPFEVSMCSNGEWNGQSVKTGCGYRDSAHNLYGSGAMTLGSISSKGMSGSARVGLGYSTHVPYSPITGHVGLSAGTRLKGDEQSMNFNPILDATGSIGIEGEFGGNSYNWQEPWNYGGGVYGKQDLAGGTGTTIGLYGNVGLLSGKVGYNKNTGTEATIGFGIPIRKTGGFKYEDGGFFGKIRKRLAKNLYPVSYSGDPDEDGVLGGPIDKVALALKGKKSVFDDRTGNKDEDSLAIQERTDLLQVLMGQDQQYNSISESKYKPTKGDNIDGTFYSSSLTEDMLRNKLTHSGWDEFPTQTVTGGGPLGNFTIDKGEDERGKYVSYYDKWDLSPFKKGFMNKVSDKIQSWAGINPPEVYGRVYMDEIGNVSSKKENPIKTSKERRGGKRKCKYGGCW